MSALEQETTKPNPNGSAFVSNAGQHALIKEIDHKLLYWVFSS